MLTQVPNRMMEPGSFVPPGAVMSFAMSAAPIGWLPCDGAAISRTTFAPLFSAVKTAFGAGNGSTTFNVPDLRGEFIRGWSAGRDVDTGRDFGSSQIDEFKNHQHKFGADDQIGPAGTYTKIDNFAYDAQSTLAGNGGGFRTKNDSINFGGNETRPRNIALLYCIKY
jgi:microcystin-dependent protein